MTGSNEFWYGDGKTTGSLRHTAGNGDQAIESVKAVRGDQCAETMVIPRRRLLGLFTKSHQRRSLPAPKRLWQAGLPVTCLTRPDAWGTPRGEEPVGEFLRDEANRGWVGCEATGSKKPRAYSLQYVEDFFEPGTTQAAHDRSPQ